MFIHVGNNLAIRSNEIVSIIDSEVIASSSIMEEMIRSKKKDQLVFGTQSNAKSVIILNEKIYFSTLSVLTLKKRSSLRLMLDKNQTVLEK